MMLSHASGKGDHCKGNFFVSQSHAQGLLILGGFFNYRVFLWIFYSFTLGLNYLLFIYIYMCILKA